MQTNSLVTVLGGVEIEIGKLDGTRELVKIRQLRLRDSQRYLQLINGGDEEGMISLFCDRDKSWIDSLDLVSAETIVVEGEKLNADFMKRCAERAKSRREMLVPGWEEKMMPLLADRLANGLQKLLSKPATASSNSATAPSAKFNS